MKPHEIYDTEIDKLLDNIGGGTTKPTRSALAAQTGPGGGQFFARYWCRAHGPIPVDPWSRRRRNQKKVGDIRGL